MTALGTMIPASADAASVTHADNIIPNTIVFFMCISCLFCLPGERSRAPRLPRGHRRFGRYPAPSGAGAPGEGRGKSGGLPGGLRAHRRFVRSPDKRACGSSGWLHTGVDFIRYREPGRSRRRSLEGAGRRKIRGKLVTERPATRFFLLYAAAATCMPRGSQGLYDRVCEDFVRPSSTETGRGSKGSSASKNSTTRLLLRRACDHALCPGGHACTPSSAVLPCSLSPC